MSTRKLRVGVIGAGGVSRARHIPGWNRMTETEVVAVADVNITAAQAAADEHHIGRVFTDYRKLVALKDIDVVSICTPNRSHTPIALAALTHGKHVLCEKPLATSPAEVEQMIAAARKAKRLLTVMQNHRYSGITQAIKRWIDAGNLGQPYFVRAWALRRNLLPGAAGFISKKLSGGGVCMDMGVHCLDLALFLLDFPEPVTVTGSVGAFLAKTDTMPGGWGEWDRKLFNVEDFACAMVRFSNGMMLTLEASWLAHLPEKEVLSVMALGAKAGITWPSGIISTTASGALVDATIQPLPAHEWGHYTAIERFHEAIINHLPSPVPADQALKTVRILDGVYRSQKAGKEVRV